MSRAADRECYISRSVEETIQLGRMIAKGLEPPVAVLLTGELGSGKTSVAKGIISGLGVAAESDVSSPTFTLVHTFHGNPKVYHVDLYRLPDQHALESVGLEDIFAEHAVIVVEWPERLHIRIACPRVRITLDHVGEAERRITVTYGL